MGNKAQYFTRNGYGAFGKMPEDVRKKAFEKLDELERQEKEQNGET